MNRPPIPPDERARVLVRGVAYPSSLYACRALAIVVMGCGLLHPGQGERFVLLAAGAIGSLVTEIVIFWHGRKQCWIEDTGTGFTVTDRRGSQTFRDEQVVAVACHEYMHYFQGAVSGDVKYFAVWLADAEKPVDMTIVVKPDAVDSLAGLRHRLYQCARERVTREFAAGRPMTGEGWRLDRNGLEWQGKLGREWVRCGELTHVGVYDRHVRFWAEGIRPVITIPLATRNACLVCEVLGPYLDNRKRQAEPVEGLGRLLFEVRAGKVPIALVAISAVGASGIGLYLFHDWWWPAAAALTLSLGLRFVVGQWWTSALRCHEHGVCIRTFASEQRIRNDDILAFRHQVRQSRQLDAYLYTIHELAFLAKAVPTARLTMFRVRVSSPHTALWDACEEWIDRISQRMEQELRAGQDVDWTAKLGFSSQGLVIRGSLRRPKVVSLDQIARIAFDARQSEDAPWTLVLWERGSENPIAQQADDAMNFVPGYRLLLRLTGLSVGAAPFPPLPKLPPPMEV